MRMPVDGSWLYKFLWILVRVLMPLFCRVKLEGAEHVPLEGGCVLVCNHNMGPDYLLLGVSTRRQIHYMGKSEIFDYHPLLTKLFNSAGVFPVERGKQDKVALERAVRLVQDGCVLGMFPEGTRSRTGQLQRGKSGAARIAMAANAPVIPAVVIDSALVFRRPFRRPRVTVRFAEPMIWQGDVANDPAAARAFTDWFMRTMAEMLPPELRGAYAELDEGDVL